MRVALVVLVLIGLAGCHPKPAADAAAPEDVAYAHSERALYRAVKVAGAAPLRPGLWARTDAACLFLETDSAGVWPRCAEFLVVRPRLLISHHGGDSLERLSAESYLLIDGYPGILQLAQGLGRLPRLFLYRGVRPLASDVQGRIVRARIWDVACGEGPQSDVEASATSPESPPLSCSMGSQGQVRSAIIAAERPRDTDQVYHWVRDEEH